MYNEIPFGVRWSCEEASGTRDWFVTQGYSLSPYLWHVFMDGIICTGDEEDTCCTCSRRSNNTCSI